MQPRPAIAAAPGASPPWPRRAPGLRPAGARGAKTRVAACPPTRDQRALPNSREAQSGNQRDGERVMASQPNSMRLVSIRVLVDVLRSHFNIDETGRIADGVGCTCGCSDRIVVPSGRIPPEFVDAPILSQVTPPLTTAGAPAPRRRIRPGALRAVRRCAPSDPHASTSFASHHSLRNAAVSTCKVHVLG